MRETTWRRLEIGLSVTALAALALVCARLLGVIGADYSDVVANTFAALVVAWLFVRYLRARRQKKHD